MCNIYIDIFSASEANATISKKETNCNYSQILALNEKRNHAHTSFRLNATDKRLSPLYSFLMSPFVPSFVHSHSLIEYRPKGMCSKHREYQSIARQSAVIAYLPKVAALNCVNDQEAKKLWLLISK